MRALTPLEVERLEFAAGNGDGDELSPEELQARAHLSRRGLVAASEDEEYFYTEITPRGQLALRAYLASLGGA